MPVPALRVDVQVAVDPFDTPRDRVLNCQERNLDVDEIVTDLESGPLSVNLTQLNVMAAAF